MVILKTPELCDAVPRNLYLTAAILIRAGFVTLEDLYPHVRTLVFYIHDIV